MKFITKVSPNLRQKQSTQRIMLELTFALLAIFVFSLCYYAFHGGIKYVMQACLLMGSAVATALITETFWAFFTKQKIKGFLSTSFGWITAIILALMCPISMKPYAVIIATFMAIFFGKLVFGGFGNNIFNPAALGRAIIFAAFAGALSDVVTSVTPTTLMATNYHWLIIDASKASGFLEQVGGLWQMFTGWYPGSMGETSTLLILILGVILSIRKVIDWRIPLIYLGSIFVFASGIALATGMENWLWYPAFHILTGGVAFGAVFMLTDPVTSPTVAPGRIIFAVGAAILTVLIRVNGSLPEGCLFSILIMNMLTPVIENFFNGKQNKIQKKVYIICATTFALGLGVTAYASTTMVEKATEVNSGATAESGATQPSGTDGEQAATKISSKDKEALDFDAKIESTTENSDGTTTYVVQAKGYAAMEGKDAWNTFTIIINKNDHYKIISVAATNIVDTEYVGTNVEKEEFLNQYKGLSIKEEIAIDAATGATFSSRSSLRAVLALKAALAE